MINKHEEELVRAFIKPHKKQRYISLFSSKKGREKILKNLAHFKDFNFKLLQKLEASQQNVSYITSRLNKLTNKDVCYIISENARIDGKNLKISDALFEVVGSQMGTILSIIPGKVIYYEGEEKSERYIGLKI